MDAKQFQQLLKAQDLPHSEAQMAQFAEYFTYLVEENQKMNLTALTSESDVYLKHFYDSLLLSAYVPKMQEAITLCDVGAGAGFPSLPNKILFPQVDVTIVDSLNKRIGFLERLSERLGLTNVHLFHDRAETFAGKKSPHREQYDLVTARAVAQLNVLAELCLPLVKVGGQLVVLKGSQGPTELEDAKQALAILGGKVVQEVVTELPESGDPRTLYVIEKVKATPKQYPRKPGTPNKQPLGGSR